MPIRIDKEMVITDPVHGQIPCSGIERELLDTPTFNRLHHVLQSSTVFRTFPGNNVKRFEHSLGVMHLGGEMFFNAVSNTSPQDLQTFFERLADTLIDWAYDVDNNRYIAFEYSSIHENDRHQYVGSPYSAPYPDMPLFRRRVPASLYAIAEDTARKDAERVVKNRLFTLHDVTWMYLVVFQSIRLAGLLHDVGHLPYSHILEHIMEDMHRELDASSGVPRNSDSVMAFKGVAQTYSTNDGEIAFHEQLGIEIWKKVYDDLMRSLSEEEQHDFGFFLAAVVYVTDGILRADVGKQDAPRSRRQRKVPSLFGHLHRITASVIDADRMDYCVRDAQAAGLSSEGPFCQRILSSLQMRFVNPDKPGTRYVPGRAHEKFALLFCPSMESTQQIEKLLERRWEIFTQLNFHHRVHKHSVLLQRLLTELGLEELRDEIPRLEDALPLEVSSIWQLAAAVQRTTSVDMFLLQMDDSWLETLINHKYFRKYGEAGSDLYDATWNKFDELMSGRRRYKSLIKREDEYRDIDEAFYSHLVAEGEFGLLHEISMQTNYLLGGHDPREPEDDLNALYGTLERNGLCALNVALEVLGRATLSPARLAQMLEDRVRNPIAPVDNRIARLVDVIVADSTFGPGIGDDDPVLVTRHDGAVEKLSKYSRVQQTLQAAARRRPLFHVYYVPEPDHQSTEQTILRRRLRKTFGRLAADIIRERRNALEH